jgi:hypothetical protein
MQPNDEWRLQCLEFYSYVKEVQEFFNLDFLVSLYFVNICWARQKLLMALKRLMKLFLQMQSCLLRTFICAEDTVLILFKMSGRSVHPPIVYASCCPLDICITVCFVPNMKLASSVCSETVACRKRPFCSSVNTTLNVQIPGPCNIQVTLAEVCGVKFCVLFGFWLYSYNI